jgi:Rab5 GDP/GTP exchange factor
VDDILATPAIDVALTKSRVQNFYAEFEAAMRAHPLWRDDGEGEFAAEGEGLERYMMLKLYPRLGRGGGGDTISN